MSGEESQIPAEVIAEAKSMGWSPKENFRGNAEKWVDADEFVERGKNLMPLLRANNERLQKELLTRDAKIDTLTQKLEGATVAIQKLEHHYTEANKQAVQVAKNQLKAELKEARESNDVDAEQQILGQLDTIREAERTAAAQPEKKDPPNQPVENKSDLSPEFKQWHADNPWFGPDKKKTKEVSRIAEDLRDEGTTLVGRDFMDECVRIYEEKNGTPPADDLPPNKVEGAAPRRSGTATKGFASLPQAAKEACWADAEDLVGPNKRYKTMAEWEKKYAEIYAES